MLNLLAVTFGVALSNWVSPRILSLMVATLFLAFGIHAITTTEGDDKLPLSHNPAETASS